MGVISTQVLRFFPRKRFLDLYVTSATVNVYCDFRVQPCMPSLTHYF